MWNEKGYVAIPWMRDMLTDFFFKSGNTDLKEVYNMILMLNILRCSGSLSISLHFLLSLLVRGLMTPRTVKQRPPKRNYLWPPPPENLLCVEDFAVSLKWVFQVVYPRKRLSPPPALPGLGIRPASQPPGQSLIGPKEAPLSVSGSEWDVTCWGFWEISSELGESH